MRHTAAEFSSGPTLNHNTSKPLIPPPPALPRFELPLEGIFDSADDPLDVAVTTQRPTLDATRALRVLRPGPRIRPKVEVDATSEVQVEDILLEVYAEEPPPPTRRSLLRASDPAFLPFGGHAAARPVTPFGGFSPPAPLPVVPVHTAYSAYAAYGRPIEHDDESPSVAPVAFPSAHMPLVAQGPAPQPYHAVHAAPPPPKRARRGAAIAIGSVVLVAVGLGTGLGVTVGLRNGALAELRDRAKALTSHGESPKAAAAATAPIDPPPSQVVVAPAPITPPTLAVAPGGAPAAQPAATPTISVNALPAQVIAPDAALVTFPPSAQGHRVFFDGRPMAVTPEPMTLRCGRHMVRIGSSGRPRVTDLACGVPVTLR